MNELFMMYHTDTMAIYYGLQQIYVLLDDGDRRALRGVGLTPTQYNLLLRLGHDGNRGLTITELSQLLLCTRGNTTRLVRRLEQQGLVRCCGDHRDQRLVRVSLTIEGTDRLADAQAVYTAAVDRRFGTLDATSQRLFRSLIETVVARLSDDLVSQVPAEEADAAVEDVDS